MQESHVPWILWAVIVVGAVAFFWYFSWKKS